MIAKKCLEGIPCHRGPAIHGPGACSSAAHRCNGRVLEMGNVRRKSSSRFPAAVERSGEGRGWLAMFTATRFGDPETAGGYVAHGCMGKWIFEWSTQQL